MASTYVNNLRLEEIGTGEQSGTWGDTTNTNLEIIGQAVAWGTRAIANASTDNITIADGALDADRCLGLKLTGGGQACTVTLLPNTSSKTWFMYNATAAALTFTCGSGANVIIPAGHTKVIATDGLGSGGVVHDLLTAVNLAGTTTVDDLAVTDDLTFSSDSAVISFGADADTTLTHTDGSGLTLNSTNKLMFNDASQFIQGSSATVLSIAATDEIDLTATAIDLNGTLDVSGTALVTGVLTTTAATVFNGGFASNAVSNVIAADGVADNAFVVNIKNQEATDDRSFGLKIQAGSTATDRPFLLTTHDDGTELFDVRGSGQVRFVDGTVALPSISNIGDANTGIFFPAADTIGFATASKTLLTLTETVADFNPGAINIDFNVRSDGNDTMLFVDGADNQVRIGTGTDIDGFNLVVQATTGAGAIAIRGRADDISQIQFYEADGSTVLARLDARNSFFGMGAIANIPVNIIVNNNTMAVFGSEHLTISNGNLIIGTAGHGIDFSTGGTSGADNLLDEYEEGTWTPAITATTGSLTTVNSVVGTYIKVGRKLTVFFSFNVADVGNGSGFLNVDDIPFTEDNSAIQFYTGIVRARSGNTVTVSSGISELDADGTLYLYGNQVRTGLFHGQVTFKTT